VSSHTVKIIYYSAPTNITCMMGARSVKSSIPRALLWWKYGIYADNGNDMKSCYIILIIIIYC